MLAIEVELLAGRYVATVANDRNAVEWPPHPARFFSAMVSALGHASRRAASEAAVVVQLENSAAPQVVASNLAAGDRTGRRTVNTVYVPVNDTALVGTERLLRRLGASDQPTPTQAERLRNEFAKAIRFNGDASKEDLARAAGLLPHHRARQARTFPSISPDVPRFWFVWPDLALAEGSRAALAAVLERVIALGHSSSLVRCALVLNVPEDKLLSRLVPATRGPLTLRWVAPGQVDRLDVDFERHQGFLPRVMPAIPQAYVQADRVPPAMATAQSVFEPDGWLLLECVTPAKEGRFLNTRSVDVAKALHGALATHALPQPAMEIITGRRDGRPSQQPHLALIPLPDVGHPHANGGILGVALVFPRQATEQDRLHVIDALLRFERAGSVVVLPRGATLRTRRVDFSESRALQESTWVGPATTWVTATPIALDRNPGDLRKAEAMKVAAQTVAEACTRVGLPSPRSVEVSLAPFLAGSRHIRDYQPFPRESGRIRRVRVHASIDFAEPVIGPVILGAGRYVGLGLCRPVGGGS